MSIWRAGFLALGLAGTAATAQQTTAPVATSPRKPPQTKAAASDQPVAVLGLLDKRLGTTVDVTLKPGGRFNFGRLSGVMQSCETTQPFEQKQSAAFVQIVEQPPALQGEPAPPKRVVFSGWLFAESPSLNPFNHPVYDVWLKSCTMRFPEGPKPPASPASRKPAAAPTAPAPATPPATPEG